MSKIPSNPTLAQIIELCTEAMRRGESAVRLTVYEITSPNDCEGRSARIDALASDENFAAKRSVLAWRMGYEPTDGEMFSRIAETRRFQRSFVAYLGCVTPATQHTWTAQDEAAAAEIAALEARIREIKAQQTP